MVKLKTAPAGRWLLALLASFLPLLALQAAPWAVYDLDVRGTQYKPAGISTENLRHIAVLDLDPATTNALTLALIVPADGAVYLTDEVTGMGTAITRTSTGVPRAYTTVSLKILSHPTLSNFIGHMTGMARNSRQTLVAARKASTLRGVPVAAAPAVILNDLGPQIQYASFLSGYGHSPVDMIYNGRHEALDTLGTHRLTLKLNKALTSVANQAGGAFAPVTRSLPARAMPTVDAAGGPKAFLREALLALNYAPDDIVDLEPVILNTFYRDLDLDGYGDAANSVQAQIAPVGYIDNAFDCDDSNPNSSPDAQEICDTTDNDCDGVVDDVPGLLSDMSNCGSCFNACPQQSGYSCAAGVCICTPTTCVAQGVQCGAINDNCGNIIQCGTCPAGEICVTGKCLAE